MSKLAAIAVGTMLDGSTLLRAQLPKVANDPWTAFVHALTISDECRDAGMPRAFDARTSAGGFGCFDLRPRRLADISLMRNIRIDNTSGKPIVVGDFVRPMTEQKFLASPLAQYNSLLESLRRYDIEVVAADGMTRSGVLALLHRLGPQALAKWAAHQEASTIALFKRTNGLF